MENHPIPQDVTGFKFKLIGSLTIKQFLYLMGAGVIAAIIFILPIAIFIKIPFIAIPVLVGLGLAFVPIEGRPMDIMLMNFIKTIPSENRYIYRKRGAEALIVQFFKPNPSQKKLVEQKSAKEEKRRLLYNKLIKSDRTYRPDKNEEKFLETISSYFNDETQKTADPAQVVKVSPPPQAPKPAVVARPVKLPVVPEPQQTAQAPKPPRLDTKPIQKQSVAKPIVKPSPQPKPPPTIDPPPKKAVAKPVAGTQVTTPESQLKAGFPTIPDIPNIVMGIIKSPRGKILPSILVEIVDKNNTPVRAFKTNALGQFASATPLPNGKYTVLLDDPRKLNEFSTVAIELTGEIFQPLEIASTDQREKLRQELFGSQRPVQTA